MPAHIGARPEHAEAQGRQYALNKKDANKYGVGLWKDVEDLWEEYNCRHKGGIFGIILGISEPQYTSKELEEMKDAKVMLNGKEVLYYEATQKQRQLENAIRKQKREVQIREKANIDATTQRSQLHQLQQKYTAFCKETGLQKDYSRIRVAKVSTRKDKDDKILSNNKIEEKELQYIGKIDKNKLGRYKDKVITDDVIITDERIEHIKQHHPDLKDKEIQFVKDVLNNPDIIFNDKKNKDTILMVKSIASNNKNYKMVVKLNTNIELNDKSNSVISFWNISDKKVRQYKRNEEIIYQKLDNAE